MADIFISYAREDHGKVVPFVELLESQGWSVWWDREINPGLSFSKVIEQQLSLVKCVIVFWSRHSVTSDWVHAEAGEGLQRSILIPVLLEDIAAPLVFRQVQAANLAGWPTKADEQILNRLLSSISELISKPTVEVAGLTSKRKWWPTVAGLALITATILGFFLADTTEFSADQPDVPNTVSQPSASIYVMPFAGMQNDISIEVGDLLARLSTIHIIRFDPLNKKEQATFSLKAIQAENRLIVSLYDNAKQQTLINIELNLAETDLDEAARTIAQRIAQEFRQPLVSERQVVPNEIYLRYLQARSIQRQPPTEANVSLAIDELSAIITAAPRFGEAQASMCVAYIGRYRNTGETLDFENAEKHCFRANRLADSNPLISVALGHLYATAGQLPEATSSFEKALGVSPFLTEAISGLATVKLMQEKIDESVHLYEQAQEYEPDNWVYYNKLAELYFRRGSYQLAVEQYLLAKRLITNQSMILSDLGAAYLMLEDFDNAVANWEASLRIESSYSALSNIGSAYYFRGDFEQALISYGKAIEINASDYRIWMNAGEAAFHAGKTTEEYYQKAIELAESGLAINPDHAETLSALAQCYASVGDEIKAQLYIQRALRSAGNDIYVLYDVAVAYSRLGDSSSMADTLNRMVANGYSRTLINRDANFSKTKKENYP